MGVNRRRVLAAVAGGTGLAGCLGRSIPGIGRTGPDQWAEPVRAQTDAKAEIWMEQTAFEPVRLAVPAGTTVTWRNADLYRHDVRSMRTHKAAEEWSFYEVSGLPDREKVTYTFDEPGVYEYHCHNHGYLNMCGVVLVGGAVLSDPLPCEVSDEYEFGSHEHVHVEETTEDDDHTHGSDDEHNHDH